MLRCDLSILIMYCFTDPLSYRSLVVVFLDYSHPCPQDFTFTVSIVAVELTHSIFIISCGTYAKINLLINYSTWARRK